MTNTSFCNGEYIQIITRWYKVLDSLVIIYVEESCLSSPNYSEYAVIGAVYNFNWFIFS